MAVTDLTQPVIDLVAVRRHTDLAAHKLHGLPRPAERRRHERDAFGMVRILGQNVCKQLTGTNRLRLAEFVQRNVLRPLKAAGRIPFSLAMADEVNNGIGHRATGFQITGDWRERPFSPAIHQRCFRKIDGSSPGRTVPAYSLPREMSGASGRFMPTT